MDRRGRERVLPRTTAAGERSPTAETALLACAFFPVQYPLSLVQYPLSLVQYPLSLVGLVGLFALSPAVLVEPWTLVTSVYAHGGPGHLLANLLGLVLLGAVVERVTTRLRFHALFVSTGALAGLAEVVPGSLSTLAPRGVLGASGAVFALMGYAIAGNGLADRLLDAVDRATTARWAVTAVLVVAAVVLAVLLSGPGSALVSHATGLALGLFAGRLRLLHVVDRRRPR